MNNIRGENVMEEKEFNNDKKTVLIVDDEKPIVDILVYNLQVVLNPNLPFLLLC